MVIIDLKRHGCKDILIKEPTRHDIGVALHMAATANNDGTLEYIRIENRFEENIIKEYNEIW